MDEEIIYFRQFPNCRKKDKNGNLAKYQGEHFNLSKLPTETLKKELQTLEMQYKETKDKDLYVKLIDKQIEVRRNKFYANDVFNSIIEIISEEG